MKDLCQYLQTFAVMPKKLLLEDQKQSFFVFFSARLLITSLPVTVANENANQKKKKMEIDPPTHTSTDGRLGRKMCLKFTKIFTKFPEVLFEVTCNLKFKVINRTASYVLETRDKKYLDSNLLGYWAKSTKK